MRKQRSICGSGTNPYPSPPPEYREREARPAYRGREPNGVRRRAFALYIMLVVLALLAIFSLLASRLFLSTIRTMRSASDVQMSSVRIDSVLHRLRADMWNSTESRLDGDILVIKRAGAPAATWTMAADWTVTRMEDGVKDVNRWREMPAKLTFEPRSASVLVRIDEGPGKPKSELILVSQLRLAGGEQR